MTTTTTTTTARLTRARARRGVLSRYGVLSKASRRVARHLALTAVARPVLDALLAGRGCERSIEQLIEAAVPIPSGTSAEKMAGGSTYRRE